MTSGSLLTSNLNSVVSITNATMLEWPLNATFSRSFYESLWSIDLRARTSLQVKINKISLPPWFVWSPNNMECVLNSLRHTWLLVNICNMIYSSPHIIVAMTREKEDLTLHDTHYRRDFLTYDNQLLDGELFLQVSFWMSIIILATQLGPYLIPAEGSPYSFDSHLRHKTGLNWFYGKG